MSQDHPSTTVQVYQVRISLRHVDPPIWRRVRLRSDTTIAQLHAIVQIAMGWQDVHLHQFRIQGKNYGVGREGGIVFSHDPHQVRLADFQLRAGESFVYEYDMGDFWQHDLRLEKVLPFESGTTFPVCTEGEGDCPREDSGGPAGFMERQEERSDPDELEAAKADILQVAQHILTFLGEDGDESEGADANEVTSGEPGAPLDRREHFRQEAFLEALERMQDRLENAPVRFDRRAVNAALRKMRPQPP